MSPSARRTDLLALTCQMSTRGERLSRERLSLSLSLPVVTRLRSCHFVYSRARKVLTISSAHSQTLVSRAMCNINPASVSSLSRTGCPRTKGTMIYIFGPVFSPRIYRINVPVRFHVSCWHWRPIFVLSKQSSVSDGRYTCVRVYMCVEENTGHLAIFLSVLDGIRAIPPRVCTA